MLSIVCLPFNEESLLNITAKSRYALKIMMDLAAEDYQNPQQRHIIASRQKIPLDFMDQITSKLRSSGLLDSIRGRNGGFKLAKKASEISILDIFKAVEDCFYPVMCLEGESCGKENTCISIDVWKDLYAVVDAYLTDRTLEEAVENWKAKHPDIDLRKLGLSNENETAFGTCERPHGS